MSTLREYADPPRAGGPDSVADRMERGRGIRSAVTFEAALRSAASGIDVWLCGERGLASISPVAVQQQSALLDVVDVDDALPGPWELDLVTLARMVAHDWGSGAISDLAVGYQRAVASLAAEPLHALSDVARAIAMRALDDTCGATEEAARRLLVAKGSTVRLRPDRVAARWNSSAVTSEDAGREIAQYRETLPEWMADLIGSYRVADALGDAFGRRMVLLARDRDDLLLLEGLPVHATPLESVVGPWRDGSDLQRVLRARESVPLVPRTMIGWTTSSDGAVARAWSRARAMPKGCDVDRGSKKRRARLLGVTLGLIHGRSGDAATLAGFVGHSRRFAKELTRTVRS